MSLQKGCVDRVGSPRVGCVDRVGSPRVGCVDGVGSPREGCVDGMGTSAGASAGGQGDPVGASAGSLELMGCGWSCTSSGARALRDRHGVVQGSVFPVTVRSFPSRYLPPTSRCFHRQRPSGQWFFTDIQGQTSLLISWKWGSIKCNQTKIQGTWNPLFFVLKACRAGVPGPC